MFFSQSYTKWLTNILQLFTLHFIPKVNIKVFFIKIDYALNEGLQNQWAPSIQFVSQILVGQDG
jgi:hypothetical protein